MTLATIAEADREWARNVGAQRPDQAWILSDRDAWYPNPYYTGPTVRHPDDDYSDDELAGDFPLPAAPAEPFPFASAARVDDGDDDIPF
jgi:hypothetical protein